MQRFAFIPWLILTLSIFLILCGCGGGHSLAGTVTQVTILPTTLSLNSGDVVSITASPVDSAGNAVTATISFNSSNPALAGVSPAGLVCGGVWDEQFIVCNGADPSGNPVSGNATITASAQGISSSPLPVTVHVKVTSMSIDPLPGCTSTTMTRQFTAHACSTVATPFDTTGPCAPNAKEVTSDVSGQIAWGTLNAAVATVNSTGLATAVNPGLTAMTAGISNTTSSISAPPASFRTCMPIEIRLHIQGQPTESANLTTSQTLTLETDMVDESGFTQNSISTFVGSDFPTVASETGLTLIASSLGGAGIISGCTPPTCGAGLNIPVYSNLFPVTVPGDSPTTMVYATSSFVPPNGTSSTLIPINTSTNTAGTAVNLPGTPNSMVFAANGSIAYLGSTVGLLSFTPGSGTTTTVDPNILGKVLAVSADGSVVIVSNAAADPEGNVIEPIGPSQRLWVFTQANSSTSTFVKPGAIAASIGNDGFHDYVATNDGSGNIYVFSPLLSLQTINIGGTSSSAASLSSGPFAYIANSAGLEVVATCNNVQQAIANNPPTNSANIQLVQAVPNADAIVAVDSPGIDFETATVSSIFHGGVTFPFTLTPANCQPNVAYSNQFINFGVGSFTANQLLVASNGSRVAVIPANSPNILTAVPGATPSVAVIPFAAEGATEAVTGGMTPDGNNVWVGVKGSNTVDLINLVTGTDAAQIPTTFTQFDGSPAPPDIVAVQPH